MDMPPLPDEESVLTKQTDRLATLEFENAQLKMRIAALEARLPQPEKPLAMADLKVVGYQRPTLSLPEADWMPSQDELKSLARIVHKTYPDLVDFNQDWLRQFRIGMLALGHFGRTPEPNRKSWGVWIGEWLTDHRHFDGLGRGPLMSAIAASGICFTGFAENYPLRGVLPAAAISRPNTGSPPDRSGWKRVLAENRLVGEVGTASPAPGQSRWDNPRAHVELLPEIDRLKGL